MLSNSRGSVYIVPLACDLDDEGRALGIDTISRCHKASEVYGDVYEDGVDPQIVLSAGLADRKNYPHQTQSLGKMMEYEFVCKCNIPPQSVHFIGPVWGTQQELRRALEQTVINGGSDKRCFHVITSWYHVPRVWVLCRRIFPNFKIYSAPGKFRNALPELWKLPGEILSPLLSPILKVIKS